MSDVTSTDMHIFLIGCLILLAVCTPTIDPPFPTAQTEAFSIHFCSGVPCIFRPSRVLGVPGWCKPIA